MAVGRAEIGFPQELLWGHALHRIDGDFRLVQEYDMAGIHFTNAALRPLLGDLTLDLYVDVIALEVEGISFTPRHLFGKEHLKGYRRWRRCLLQLLATSEPVDSFRVLPRK
jgi:hypothetical protein